MSTAQLNRRLIALESAQIKADTPTVILLVPLLKDREPVASDATGALIVKGCTLGRWDGEAAESFLDRVETERRRVHG